MKNKYNSVISITLREKDDKTLLIHRINPPKVFSPPGGFCQKSLKYTSIKEIKEETGLKVKNYYGQIGTIDNNVAVTASVVRDKPLTINCGEWDIIGWFSFN